MLSSICTQNRALVLIPCCKNKRIPTGGSSFSGPIDMGILKLRRELLAEIGKDEKLSNRKENRVGILHPGAKQCAAVDLYCGRFYEIARNELQSCLRGNIPIDVLIVSAFYGIAPLSEGLCIYDLKMNDLLPNGQAIFNFWQKRELSNFLGQYAQLKRITHIWSLLPDSNDAPYHRVFKDFWKKIAISNIFSCHLKVTNAGSGSGQKRAEWLSAAIRDNPGYLIGEPFPPKESAEIPGYVFLYDRC